jgi:hypothetical protein
VSVTSRTSNAPPLTRDDLVRIADGLGFDPAVDVSWLGAR